MRLVLKLNKNMLAYQMYDSTRYIVVCTTDKLLLFFLYSLDVLLLPSFLPPLRPSCCMVPDHTFPCI